MSYSWPMTEPVLKSRSSDYYTRTLATSFFKYTDRIWDEKHEIVVEVIDNEKQFITYKLEFDIKKYIKQ